MNAIDRMRSELVLDSLRRAYRLAVETLIAAGISEEDARTAAISALGNLLVEQCGSSDLGDPDAI